MDTTLLKGLNVLEYVARAEGGVRITDLAGDLNLTKSNAFRVLKTLESAGYVRQDLASKNYSISIKLWELGTLVQAQRDLRAQAQGPLQKLSLDSRETVHLAVLDGAEVLYVDKIDSSEPVAAYTRLGGRAPAYCVATGKALLSQLGEDALAPLLVDLRRHSEFTITDPEVLRAELRKAKSANYSINRGEWRSSVWGLASVVRNMAGKAVAAVGVSGPEYRLSSEGRSEELALLVVDAAARISRNLGFNP
jgi:DNA-binding IclR family transcriptional regulator